MQNDSTPLLFRPFTPRQSLAGLFARWAQALGEKPTGAEVIASLRQASAHDAEVQLLAALAEEERWRFTVQMLQARLDRLRAVRVGAP